VKKTKRERYVYIPRCPKCHHTVREEQLLGVGCPICGWVNPRNTVLGGDGLTDVFDEKDRIEIITMIPPTHEDDIRIDVKDNLLLISVDDYRRSISLFSDVETDVETTYNNGVLAIKLKKKGDGYG